MVRQTKTCMYIQKSLARSSLPCFFHRFTYEVDFVLIKTAKVFFLSFNEAHLSII